MLRSSQQQDQERSRGPEAHEGPPGRCHCRLPARCGTGSPCPPASACLAQSRLLGGTAQKGWPLMQTRRHCNANAQGDKDSTCMAFRSSAAKPPLQRDFSHRSQLQNSHLPKQHMIRPKVRLSFIPLGMKMQILERDKVKTYLKKKQQCPRCSVKPIFQLHHCSL